MILTLGFNIVIHYYPIKIQTEIDKGDNIRLLNCIVIYGALFLLQTCFYHTIAPKGAPDNPGGMGSMVEINWLKK